MEINFMFEFVIWLGTKWT